MTFDDMPTEQSNVLHSDTKTDAGAAALQCAEHILFQLQKRDRSRTPPHMRDAIRDLIHRGFVRQSAMSPFEMAVYILEGIQKRQRYGCGARDDISGYLHGVMKGRGLLSR